MEWMQEGVKLCECSGRMNYTVKIPCFNRIYVENFAGEENPKTICTIEKHHSFPNLFLAHPKKS